MIEPIQGHATDTATATTVQPKVQPPAENSLDRFFTGALQAMKTQEERMRGGLMSAADPNSALMRMPEHMREEFRRLDDAAKTTEEKELVARFKKGVTETFEANRDFYRDKLESKVASVEMKIGVQMVSNTVRGVQQLLTAQ